MPAKRRAIGDTIARRMEALTMECDLYHFTLAGLLCWAWVWSSPLPCEAEAQAALAYGMVRRARA